MRILKSLSLLAVSSLALAACGGSGGTSGGARDFVRVVGSSTLYPFATAVAEQAAKSAGIKSPVVESTGTGAGMKLFCAGVGAAHPDIENASRRMKKSELEDCAKNGVTEVIEIQVGIDGIAISQAKDAQPLNLTLVDVYKALAANPFGKPNTAKLWSDVNPALPAFPILVYGPPETAGTRDAMAELILIPGCESDPAMKALKETDKDAHKKTCSGVRDDGAFVVTGENDNLTVQKLVQNTKTVGIFGYSYLAENPEKLRGIPVAGVTPTYATISDFSYPGARPLYIYVKGAHLKAIKGLADYVREWPKTWGPDGLLKAKGMVVSPDDVRAANAAIVEGMKPLDPSQLK